MAVTLLLSPGRFHLEFDRPNSGLMWHGNTRIDLGTGLAWAGVGFLCHALSDACRALLIDNALSGAVSVLGTVAFFSGLALFGWHLWTHRHVLRHG